MKKKFFILTVFFITACFILTAGDKKFETEVIETTKGPLKITFIGHASLIFTFNNMIIHVDPFSRMADYTKLPKADLVLVTHHHGDHLDTGAIEIIRTGKTQIVLTKICSEKVEGVVMGNGDTKTVKGLKVEAVPAYNILHKRDGGQLFHPKGEGNGYIITFGDKRVYVAGDTENTQEMKKLKAIDIAFLPMNLPYTMTPEMVLDAAKAFKPKILFIYHFAFGKTDIPKLKTLMKDIKEIDLRIHNQ